MNVYFNPDNVRESQLDFWLNLPKFSEIFPCKYSQSVKYLIHGKLRKFLFLLSVFPY